MGGNAVVYGERLPALFAMMVMLWSNMHTAKLQWNSYGRLFEFPAIPLLTVTPCQPQLDSSIKKLLICR